MPTSLFPASLSTKISKDKLMLDQLMESISRYHSVLEHIFDQPAQEKKDKINFLKQIALDEYQTIKKGTLYFNLVNQDHYNALKAVFIDLFSCQIFENIDINPCLDIDSDYHTNLPLIETHCSNLHKIIIYSPELFIQLLDAANINQTLKSKLHDLIIKSDNEKCRILPFLALFSPQAHEKILSLYNDERSFIQAQHMNKLDQTWTHLYFLLKELTPSNAEIFLQNKDSLNSIQLLNINNWHSLHILVIYAPRTFSMLLKVAETNTNLLSIIVDTLIEKNSDHLSLFQLMHCHIPTEILAAFIQKNNIRRLCIADTPLYTIDSSAAEKILVIQKKRCMQQISSIPPTLNCFDAFQALFKNLNTTYEISTLNTPSLKLNTKEEIAFFVAELAESVILDFSTPQKITGLHKLAYYAPKILPAILQCALKQPPLAEALSTALFTEDQFGLTTFDIMVCYDTSEIWHSFYKLLQKRPNTTSFILQNLVHHRPAIGSALKIMTQFSIEQSYFFIQTIKEINKEYLKELETAVPFDNIDDWPACHLAIYASTLYQTQTYKDLLSDPERFLEAFSAKNNNGKTAFNFMPRYAPDLLEKILNLAFNSSPLLTALIESKLFNLICEHSENNTLLFIKLAKNHSALRDEIAHCIFKKRESAGQVKQLDLYDSVLFNIITKTPRALTLLFDLAKSDHKIHDMLAKALPIKDNRGRTLLHVLSTCSAYFNSVEQLLQFAGTSYNHSIQDTQPVMTPLPSVKSGYTTSNTLSYQRSINFTEALLTSLPLKDHNEESALDNIVHNAAESTAYLTTLFVFFGRIPFKLLNPDLLKLYLNFKEKLSPFLKEFLKLLFSNKNPEAEKLIESNSLLGKIIDCKTGRQKQLTESDTLPPDDVSSSYFNASHIRLFSAAAFTLVSNITTETATRANTKGLLTSQNTFIENGDLADSSTFHKWWYEAKHRPGSILFDLNLEEVRREERAENSVLLTKNNLNMNILYLMMCVCPNQVGALLKKSNQNKLLQKSLLLAFISPTKMGNTALDIFPLYANGHLERLFDFISTAPVNILSDDILRAFCSRARLFMNALPPYLEKNKYNPLLQEKTNTTTLLGRLIDADPSETKKLRAVLIDTQSHVNAILNTFLSDTASFLWTLAERPAADFYYVIAYANSRPDIRSTLCSALNKKYHLKKHMPHAAVIEKMPENEAKISLFTYTIDHLSNEQYAEKLIKLGLIHQEILNEIIDFLSDSLIHKKLKFLISAVNQDTLILFFDRTHTMKIKDFHPELAALFLKMLPTDHNTQTILKILSIILVQGSDSALQKILDNNQNNPTLLKLLSIVFSQATDHDNSVITALIKRQNGFADIMTLAQTHNPLQEIIMESLWKKNSRNETPIDLLCMLAQKEEKKLIFSLFELLGCMKNTTPNNFKEKLLAYKTSFNSALIQYIEHASIIGKLAPQVERNTLLSSLIDAFDNNSLSFTGSETNMRKHVNLQLSKVKEVTENTSCSDWDSCSEKSLGS